MISPSSARQFAQDKEIHAAPSAGLVRGPRRLRTVLPTIPSFVCERGGRCQKINPVARGELSVGIAANERVVLGHSLRALPYSERRWTPEDRWFHWWLQEASLNDG